MQVNFTIVVQAVNFFVAYALMRRFLFRPTISMLESEEAYGVQLETQVLDQRAQLETLEKNMQSEWGGYQNKIAQKIPVLEPLEKRDKVKVLGIRITPIPSDSQGEMVDQVASAITDGIRDVVY